MSVKATQAVKQTVQRVASYLAHPRVRLPENLIDRPRAPAVSLPDSRHPRAIRQKKARSALPFFLAALGATALSCAAPKSAQTPYTPVPSVTIKVGGFQIVDQQLFLSYEFFSGDSATVQIGTNRVKLRYADGLTYAFSDGKDYLVNILPSSTADALQFSVSERTAQK